MRGFQFWTTLVFVGLLSCSSLQAADEPTEENIKYFRTSVLPILKSKCLKCHGLGDKVKGGLKLTSRAALLKGGDSGSAIDPDDLMGSVLLQAVHYDGLEMPPSGKLPDKEVKVLKPGCKTAQPGPKDSI